MTKQCSYNYCDLAVPTMWGFWAVVFFAFVAALPLVWALTFFAVALVNL